MEMNLEHIKEISTWNSGGGVMLDLITLKDGRVLVVSDDVVVLYENMEEVTDGEAKDRPLIYL